MKIIAKVLIGKNNRKELFFLPFFAEKVNSDAVLKELQSSFQQKYRAKLSLGYPFYFVEGTEPTIYFFGAADNFSQFTLTKLSDLNRDSLSEADATALNIAIDRLGYSD